MMESMWRYVIEVVMMVHGGGDDNGDDESGERH